MTRPGRRLAWSTAFFAAATGLSRVLGLFREIVARRYFGVEGPINAFTVAFQVPNLVRALAADMALGKCSGALAATPAQAGRAVEIVSGVPILHRE